MFAASMFATNDPFAHLRSNISTDPAEGELLWQTKHPRRSTTPLSFTVAAACFLQEHSVSGCCSSTPAWTCCKCCAVGFRVQRLPAGSPLQGPYTQLQSSFCCSALSLLVAPVAQRVCFLWHFLSQLPAACVRCWHHMLLFTFSCRLR